MSFDNIGLLVNDLLGQFVHKEDNEIDRVSVMSNNKLNNKLKKKFNQFYLRK